MRRTLLALWFLLLLAWPVHAAVWWLNPATGLDSNPGTVESSAWKTLFKVKTAPGVGAGDTVNIVGGTYTQAQIAGEGGVPAWTESQNKGTAGAPLTIQAKPGSTVILDGGYATYFQYFEPANGVSPVTARYVVIKDLEFRNYTTSVIGVLQASYVAVINCYLHDLFDNTSGVLTTSNAHHVIYKNNRIFNQGDPSRGFNGTGDHAMYLSEGSVRVVVDGNTFEKTAGFGVHGWAHGTAIATTDVIVRRNTLVNNAASGLILAGGTYRNIYAYNNTFYSDPVPYAAISATPADDAMTFHNGGNYTNIVLKNNIGYGTYGRALFSQDNAAQIVSLTLDYNSWTNLAGASNTLQWNGTSYTLAGFQSTVGKELHSMTGNPLYTNSTSRVFTLQTGSPAIDAGQPLTTTTSSGSGTSVPVADAGYFHDGYGLIAGDTLVIGATTATVTAVNYSTNVLTVTPSLSWTSGQAVTFPYNGSAPDMGAFESGGGGVPPPAAGLQAQWKFDEGTGTSAADATGNAHTGTITGSSVWAPGRHGPKSLKGDGAGTITIISPAFTYTLYTWTLWIKGDAAPNTASNVQPLANGSDPDNWGFNWSNTTAGFMQSAYQQNNTGTYVTAQLTTPLQAAVWYFVAATYDGATLKAYLNGQLQGSVAVASLATAVGNFGIGNNPNRARWFAGQVDNVQLYNTALSAAEVLAEYRRQAGMYHKRITRR